MSLERGGGSRDGSEGSVGDARAEGEVEGGGGGVAREHGRAAERDGAVGGGWSGRPTCQRVSRRVKEKNMKSEI